MSNQLDLSNAIDLRIAGTDVMRLRIADIDIWARWYESRNLATNPSFETSGGTVELRRNLAINPTSAGPTGLVAHDGTVTTVTKNVPVPAPHPQGIAVAAKSQNTGTPGYNVISMFNIDGLGTTAPARWVGAWFYSATPGYVAGIGPSMPSTFVTIPAGVWTWVVSPFIIGAGLYAQTWLRTPPGGGNVNPADIGYITGVTAFADYAPTESIWGDRPAAGDYTYAWTGAANASASVQRATPVAGATPNTGGAFSYSSTEWKSSGARSIRVTPSSATDNGTYGDIVIPGLVVGKTYTALATMRLAAPLTGALNSNSRKLAARFVGGSPALAYSSQFPNVAGVYPVRFTFTIPAGTTQTSMRPYDGALAGGGDLWMDDLAVIEGTYTGPYFDGSTPDTATARHDWLGAANASASRREEIPA